MIPAKQLSEYDLFIAEEYDDWSNYRDGMRDWFGDNKLIKDTSNKFTFSHNEKRKQMNRKQELLLKRRKAKKHNTIY